MTLAQRARLWALNRKANALLRRCSRPHQASVHMTGRVVPPSFEGSARSALLAGAAVILMLVALNKFFPEPAPVQCAQVVAQK